MKQGKCREAVRFKNDEEWGKHAGKYVAIASFFRNLVIRYETGEPVADKDPAVVEQQAKMLGYEHPVLIRIPEGKICFVLTVEKSA